MYLFMFVLNSANFKVSIISNYFLFAELIMSDIDYTRTDMNIKYVYTDLSTYIAFSSKIFRWLVIS